MPAMRGRVTLWDLGSGLSLGPLRKLLEDAFGPALSFRSGRLLKPSRLKIFARGAMALRIPDPGRLGTSSVYEPCELASMTRILKGEASPEERRASPVSGIGLLALLAGELGPALFRPRAIHIVLTSLLPLTWDQADCRYHARTVLCGYPSVVSTTGAVEGPARPRGYYVARLMGLSEEEARRKYIGRFLEPDDARLPQVARGLAAQAILYHLTGEPFCDDESCLLFNAHWQEQLVAAQVESGRFCSVHARLVRSALGAGARRGK